MRWKTLECDHISACIMMFRGSGFNTLGILRFTLHLCVRCGLSDPGEGQGGLPFRGHITQHLFWGSENLILATFYWGLIEGQVLL